MSEKYENPTPPGSPAAMVDELKHEAHVKFDILELHQKVVAFAARLRERYPDAGKHRCYHRLIGSSVPPGVDVIEEDFPGEDSIIKFLESLLKEGESGA